jgi:haloacetate dehalogenase
VIPDLRGYGESACPPDEADHAQASKRAMAADLHTLMARSATSVMRWPATTAAAASRTGWRWTIPQAVTKLALLDIAPTLDMYAATDMAFARAYYHWFHLIQPAPLPERMIGGCAREYLHAKLGGWGAGGLGHVEPEALAEYERCFPRPANVHAACEDYRASAGIDLEHDRASRAAGAKIACELLLVWGAHGVVERLFDPLALWQAQCAARVTPLKLPCGHFIPEERPEDTARALGEFLG